MKKREAHCAFAKLSNGRCYADCHLIDDDGDCTGNNNKILEGQREVTVSCGFIDGRNITVDSHGYIAANVKTEEKTMDKEPGYKSYGWGTYIDTTGKVFKFDTQPDGTKVRRYIT